MKVWLYYRLSRDEDEQFDEFLKMLVHDYLSVDQPYTKVQENFVDHVDSCCA